MCACLAAVYALLLVVAYVAAFVPGVTGTLWWPPAGLAVGTLVLAPRRTWPWLLLTIGGTTLLLGILGIPAQRQISLPVGLLWAASNAGSAFAGASVYRQLARPPYNLGSVRNVVVLVGPAALAAASFNLAGNVLGRLFWAGTPPALAVAVSIAAAALGVVTIAPLLLTAPRASRAWVLGGLAESAALGLCLVLTGWAAFELPSAGAQIVALASATFPLLAWAAVRFGPRGAAWASFVLTAFATWRTSLGHGPFGASFETASGQLAYVEIFFSLATVSSLVLAAVAAERRTSERVALLLRGQVSEQTRRNEETLALLAAVLGSAPIGIAIIDPGLRVVRCNETLAHMDGLSVEAHAGRRVREVLPGVGARIEAHLRSVMESGEPVIGYRIEGRKGARPEAPTWECTWFPIRTPEGGSAGACAIVVDVTDRVVAERDRERALQQAREAVELRDDFLSVASHELKTPLTPLSARLAMMERRAAAGERIEPEAIARARTSLRKLVVLVDELLDVTHIRESSVRERWTTCSLAELVEEVAAPYRHRSSRHTIEVEVPAQEIRVACDRTSFGRVLENLLDNAIKYSPGGGRVRLRLSAEGEEAVLTVADEGIGIPRAEQASLFTRFGRATNAPTRSYGGLGLGLYVSREIVLRHGGRIAVESEEGRGSTFTVRLPVSERAAASAHE